jgi:hypothetical protein
MWISFRRKIDPAVYEIAKYFAEMGYRCEPVASYIPAQPIERGDKHFNVARSRKPKSRPIQHITGAVRAMTDQRPGEFCQIALDRR